MIYIFTFLIQLLFMLSYFKLADRFNIIDKPNQRSSHSIITIRGGGIVFYTAACTYFIWSHFQYPFFFLGLSAMALISFLDDMFTLSNKLRFSVHILSVGLLLYQVHYFQEAWYLVFLAIFAIIGIVNAYNFMDGINGITTAYSFAVLLLLWLTNQRMAFIDADLLYFIALGNLVFAFFNFRKKAKCFAGDVGSVSMSYIIIFAVFLLILHTHNPLYILFLAVYGTDATLTLFNRLLKKENVFEAHRTHLYQYLSNEARINPLLVSSIYALLQLAIGAGVWSVQYQEASIQQLFAASVLIILALLYMFLRRYILKRCLNT